MKYANGDQNGVLGSVTDNATKEEIKFTSTQKSDEEGVDYTKITYELNHVSAEDIINKKISYGYIRVSTKPQAGPDKYGVHRQKAMILRAAEAVRVKDEIPNGFYIRAFFFDKESGDEWFDDRPAVQQMMASIEQSEKLRGEQAKDVFMEDHTRIARLYEVHLDFIGEMEKRKIDLWSAATLENVTEAVRADPRRNLMVGIQALFAQCEKAIQLLRMGDGRRRRIKEKGQWIKPFGEDPKKPKEKEIKEFMESQRAQGKYLREIAAVSNKKGYRGRFGHLFTTGSVRKILDKKAWDKNIQFVREAEKKAKEEKKKIHLSREDALKDEVKDLKKELKESNTANEYRINEVLRITLRERLVILKTIQKPQDEVKTKDPYGVTKNEHKILKTILNLSIDDALNSHQIKAWLDKEKITDRFGKPWTESAIYKLITPKIEGKYFTAVWTGPKVGEKTEEQIKKMSIKSILGHRVKLGLCEKCGRERHQGACEETYERSDMRDDWKKRQLERRKKRAEDRKAKGIPKRQLTPQQKGKQERNIKMHYREKKGLCLRCGKDPHEGDCKENYQKVDWRKKTTKKGR